VRIGLGLALADPSRFAALLRISVGAIVRMPSGSPANTCLSTVCSYGESIVAERTWSAACFGPALRATRADPIKAVRPEQVRCSRRRIHGVMCYLLTRRARAIGTGRALGAAAISSQRPREPPRRSGSSLRRQ
jgi:hypothetical protein